MTRMPTIAFIAVLLTGILALAATGHATGYGLLIGIDDYSGSCFNSLRGAKNDVALMRKVLANRFGFKPENITVLTDDTASHTAIRDAFTALAAKARSGDTVYIHYSGHGSSACDISGDEPSGMDSTWVCHGSRQGTQGQTTLTDCTTMRDRFSEQTAPVDLDRYDILDDELNHWLAAISRKTDSVIFVSDSCHSGTVSKDILFRPSRGIPPAGRVYPRPIASPATPLTGVRIGACRDSEKTYEYEADGVTHGMFTWFWAQALSSAPPDATWTDMVTRTAALMEYENGGFSRQHPQIEGALSLLLPFPR